MALDEALEYLIEHHYRTVHRPLRYCHPRDLLRQVRNYCEFHGKPPIVSRETLVSTARPGMARWREHLFSSMSKNAVKASDFFHVPTNRVVELGTQVEL